MISLSRLLFLLGIRLAGLEFGACLRIVGHHRPEVFGGDLRRNMKVVVLCSRRRMLPSVVNESAQRIASHGRRIFATIAGVLTVAT